MSVTRYKCNTSNIICSVLYDIATTVTSTTTVSSEVTSGGHHLHTNSTPVSTDVTFSVAESVSSPSSTSSGIDYAQQGMCIHVSVCTILQ